MSERDFPFPHASRVRRLVDLPSPRSRRFTVRYLMLIIAVAMLSIAGVGVFKDGQKAGIPFLIAGVALFVFALRAKKAT